MNIALLSFLGIIVGATLQYFFTTYLETQRHLRELKTQAYTDFLKHLTDRKYLNATEEKQIVEARFTESNARICLYGKASVIEKLAAFLALGGDVSSKQQKEALVALFAEMRSDSSGGAAVDFDHLALVLLGKKIPAA